MNKIRSFVPHYFLITGMLIGSSYCASEQDTHKKPTPPAYHSTHQNDPFKEKKDLSSVQKNLAPLQHDEKEQNDEDDVEAQKALDFVEDEILHHHKSMPSEQNE